MLRGNYTVKMDEKGRIKLPAAYRRFIEENYGTEFYVTSVTGENARLYPMKEWLILEEKLQVKGPEDESVRKFLDRTNYYGQTLEMDPQGRILIHPLLRQKAQLSGDVAVMGYLKYLEVWELVRFEERLEKESYTADDARKIAGLVA
jgi:MraZ protein